MAAVAILGVIVVLTAGSATAQDRHARPEPSSVAVVAGAVPLAVDRAVVVREVRGASLARLARSEAGEGVGESPPPTRGSSIDTGAGQSRDVIGRSAGWPILAAVLGLMALVSLLALRPWRRRPRD